MPPATCALASQFSLLDHFSSLLTPTLSLALSAQVARTRFSGLSLAVMLIKHGASCSASDSNGSLAIELARGEQGPTLARAMLQATLLDWGPVVWGEREGV